MKKSILLLFLLVTTLTAYANSCTTHRQQFIENNKVKVWATTICPNAHLAFHTHQESRILISNTDGLLKVRYKNKKSLYIKIKADKPLWLSREEGISPHEDINLSKQPLRVIVIAVK